jgi:hypothetical protein
MYIKQINIEILKKKINVLYTNVYDIYIYIDMLVLIIV